MKKAIQILDGLQAKYQENLRKAIETEDTKMIAHWQAYLSALTLAAMELEKAS